MELVLSSDCVACKVQSGVRELWDLSTPQGRLGAPLETVCNLCARETRCELTNVGANPCDEGCPGCASPLDDIMVEAGRCPFCNASARTLVTFPGRDLRDEARLRDALFSWAVREGSTSVDEFVAASFVLGDVASLLDATIRGDALETTFDIVNFLFSQGGGVQGTTPARLRLERSDEAPTSLPPPSIQPIGTARDELLALAAVAAADGEASIADQAELAWAAERRNIPRLHPGEFRVARPGEIALPPTLVAREKLLDEMINLAWSDGHFDESEVRVIREFCRAFGIDPEYVKRAMHILTRSGDSWLVRAWRRTHEYLFPER